MPIVTCRSHCAACGTHFASTGAFDAHRIGSFSDPADPRRCQHPIDTPPGKDGLPRFAALSEEGECRVYEHREGFGIERGVTIWTLRAKLESARAHKWPSRPATQPLTP